MTAPICRWCRAHIGEPINATTYADICRYCKRKADCRRGHTHLAEDGGDRVELGMRPEFRGGTQVGWACDGCGFVERTDHYALPTWLPRVWTRPGPVDDELVLAGLTEDEYAARCVVEHLAGGVAYVEDPHSTASAVVTSGPASIRVTTYRAGGCVGVLDYAASNVWGVSDAINTARHLLTEAAFEIAEQVGNLESRWMLPPARHYEPQAWVRVDGQVGRLERLTTEATVRLPDRTLWRGDPALIEFGSGDPVTVTDPATGEYVGQVVGVHRDDTWTVLDNRWQILTVHQARHVAVRPDIPVDVDPADLDNYRYALERAREVHRLNRAQAVEALEIIYLRGVRRDLPTNDVLDLLADALPELDTVALAEEVADLFGCRID